MIIFIALLQPQLNSKDDDLKFSHAELTSIQDLAFACKRAASRMVEMSTGKHFLKNQLPVIPDQ